MIYSLISTASNNKKIIENQLFKPVFYHLTDKKDEEDFIKLLNDSSSISVIDEIHSQLEELIKLRNPKLKLTPEESQQKIENHLNGVELHKYGVWVYYPWLNKAIHLLNENEFIEVRTNRNQYKITPEEEDVLATKTIGIIGLSVGKAIALTIAMERICGELIIADFDVIELSNLNRIQTGVQNFGIKKTIVVAREIAEIDPFLKVTCLHEGLTEENRNKFFFPNDNKMDLCIEVCDGLSTKIFARQKAKEFGIPVVMNSSDRGTTDIERFDLNPELPILHGLIDHLDLDLVKQAKTNEEKVPYLLPMLGVETSSERLKASMLEIEQTITTWPQLASGVVMGGGICTDVCRRILLNQFANSGRYFVDVETLINNEVTDYISANSSKEDRINLIPNSSIADFKTTLEQIEKKLSTTSIPLHLDVNEIKKLVEYAIMAPSGGNVQPWKWLYKNNKLLLFQDPNRAKSILNYKNSASLLSFGAASENLILKAHEIGYEVKIEPFPLGVDNDLIASFEFFRKNESISDSGLEPHLFNHLITHVPNRLTNRNLSKKQPIEAETLSYLKQVTESTPDVQLKLFTSSSQIDGIKSILAEIDVLYMTNKICHSHFVHEIRWNNKEVEETRDGIDINTIDLTPTERAGLMVAKNWNVTKHIKKWNLGNEFGKLSKKAIESSGALGLVIVPKFNAENYFNGGKSIQKLWLAATEKQLAFQPMSISSFLFTKIADHNFDEIEDIKDDLIRLYNQFKIVCELNENQHDIFLFRLAKAPEPKIKALRRFTEDVLMYE